MAKYMFIAYNENDKLLGYGTEQDVLPLLKDGAHGLMTAFDVSAPEDLLLYEEALKAYGVSNG